MEESIYQTYTNLTNLTDAFGQSTSASHSIVISTNVSILFWKPLNLFPTKHLVSTQSEKEMKERMVSAMQLLGVYLDEAYQSV